MLIASVEIKSIAEEQYDNAFSQVRSFASKAGVADE
jgi:hypothetical protein